jgi:hypothetical protein
LRRVLFERLGEVCQVLLGLLEGLLGLLEGLLGSLEVLAELSERGAGLV